MKHFQRNISFSSLPFPESVKEIASIFNSKGYELYVVGGVLRDMIIDYIKKDEPVRTHKESSISSLDTSYSDIDFSTNALPDEIMKLFPRSFPTGIEHGTITVIYKNIPYEITTFRVDGTYEDYRKPSTVHFTNSIEHDLSRRDFTINAMAYNPINSEMIDLFDGIHDIQNSVVRCVGEPQERFQEDALRMLRAIRFAAKLNFQIDKDTLGAIFNFKELIHHISVERIQSEFRKLICYRSAPQGLELLYSTQLLKHLIALDKSSIDISKSFSNIKARTDSRNCELGSEEEILKLSILLSSKIFHDISMDTHINLYDLSHIYSEIAQNTLKKLKCPNSIIHAVRLNISKFTYIHISDTSTAVRFSILKFNMLLIKFGRKRALQIVNYLLHCTQILAKNISHKVSCSTVIRIRSIVKALEDESFCKSLITKDRLNISGSTLITYYSEQSGKWIGVLLNLLLRYAIKHPTQNTEDKLLTVSKKYYSKIKTKYT